MPLSRQALGFLLALLCLAPLVGAAEPVTIVNPGVAEQSLSRNAVRLIFSIRAGAWANGGKVRVFVLPDNNQLHRSFTKDLLRLYPRQLRRVWDRRLYSGTGQAPVTVHSEAEMRERVANTPGAIGYLSSESIDESVHVLLIR